MIATREPKLLYHPKGVVVKPYTKPGLLDNELRLAAFSSDMLHRYFLTVSFKTVAKHRAINFLMLNPSTADERQNDPTVERCERRAKAMGFTGYTITNLFAFRATQPKDMKAADDPVGKHNDYYILEIARRHEMVVCAWGKDGGFMNRSTEVVQLLAMNGIDRYALRLTQDGQPYHPLYVGYDVLPKLWR